MIGTRPSVGIAATIFIVCATLYALLGIAVSHAPPRGIDVAARTIAGEAPGAALIFTRSCLWPVLTVFGLIGIVAAWRAPAWRTRIIFAIVTTLVAWQLSDVLKDVFRRPRPDYWIVYHEPTFSYSSGHAMFAVLVYGLWAWHAARSRLPLVPRIIVVAALSGWGAAVIWSRMALGAHYPTDLLGGILLACGMLGLSTLVVAGTTRLNARREIHERNRRPA